MLNDLECVRRAFTGLCEPLHDAFTWADQVKRKRLAELYEDPNYGWLATHFTRGFAHYRLSKASLAPWKMAGNHARNGELWLNDGSYATRVLHTLDDEHVPPPGSNPQRIAFYYNPPLTLAEKLFGPVSDKLLILWHIDHETSVPVFRVVRPIGNWKYGSRAKTDLDFLLPQTAEELENLQFQPSDEGMELDIPDEKEGGFGVGGGTG